MDHTYSPHCSLHISYITDKENVFNDQEHPQIWIISFVVVTLMLELPVIIKIEIRYHIYSSLEVKELFSLIETHSRDISIVKSFLSFV